MVVLVRGFDVSGFGFRVSNFRFWVSGFGSPFQDFRSRVSGLGSQVSGFRFQVSVLEFQVSGFGSWSAGLRFGFSGSLISKSGACSELQVRINPRSSILNPDPGTPTTKALT